MCSASLAGNKVAKLTPCPNSSLSTMAPAVDGKEVLRQRLRTIEAELKRIGATPEFCDGYFDGGQCQMRGCVCTKHTGLSVSLPAQFMCSTQYSEYLGLLKQGVETIKTTVRAREQEIEVMKNMENVDSLFASSSTSMHAGGPAGGSALSSMAEQNAAIKVPFASCMSSYCFTF